MLKFCFTCWGKDVGREMDEDTVKLCIKNLWPKLSMHARKIGKFSRRLEEADKGHDITLKLRDILKAHIVE